MPQILQGVHQLLTQDKLTPPLIILTNKNASDDLKDYPVVLPVTQPVNPKKEVGLLVLRIKFRSINRNLHETVTVKQPLSSKTLTFNKK